MKQMNMNKLLILFVLLAAIFATGIFAGRISFGGSLSVTTQYGVGAMEDEELAALEKRVARSEETKETQTASTPAPAEESVDEPRDSLININTASEEELMTLPGIGPAIAGRIVAHRETHGPFRVIEEITDVSGIGPVRFRDMQAKITVGTD